MNLKKIYILILLMLTVFRVFGTQEFNKYNSYNMYNSIYDDIEVALEYTNIDNDLVWSIYYITDHHAGVHIFANHLNIMSYMQTKSLFSLKFNYQDFINLSYLDKFKLVVRSLEVKNSNGEIILTLDDLTEEHFKKVPDNNHHIIVLLTNRNHPEKKNVNHKLVPIDPYTVKK